MWIELISLVGRRHQGLGGWKAASEPPGSRFCCSFLSSAAHAGHRDPQKLPCTLPPALAEDVWCCCSVPGR